MKPCIAVTSRMAFFDGNMRMMVNQSYFDAIRMAGGIPVMIGYNDAEDYDGILDRFDGLLVTGGEDLDPSFFNQDHHPATVTTDVRLDVTDLEIIKLFIKAKKPILGICRGIQSLNVAMGGDLYQDINSQYEKIRPQMHQQNKMEPPIPGGHFAHTVTFAKGTVFHDIYGDRYGVNTYHHQNIWHPAEGLTISGTADDGLIEAVEVPGTILAVQWHPERLTHDRRHLAVFETFIDWTQQNH